MDVATVTSPIGLKPRILTAAILDFWSQKLQEDGADPNASC